MTLLINLASVLVLMTLGYIYALRVRRFDVVDLCWGLGFILIAWISVIKNTQNLTLLTAVIVSVWGLRLTLHIGSRHRGQPDDRRYLTITERWKGNIWAQAYYKIFLLQGLLILLVSMPISIMAINAGAEINIIVWVGAIIWSCGFIVEAVADRQLAIYLEQAKRPAVMQTGLWRYSRHPNYFGELVQWWGIGVTALSVSWGWVGLIGPALLSYLIIFVSGIPPIERKRQNDKEYQAYKLRTSPLILLPPLK